MERVKSKIISIFLLLVLIFTSLADYCVIYIQRVFIIDPCNEAAIYRAWRTRVEKRLHNMFHDIRVKDASTHWLTDEILQALKAHWDSPAFKEKQVKARTSRGLTCGDSLHTGGSATIEGTQLMMVNIVIFLFSFSIFALNVYVKIL